MEYFDLATALNGGRNYGIIKKLSVYDLRAGERKNDSTGLDPAYGFGIEPLIAFHRLVFRVLVFGEGRRIQNDEVVGGFAFFQKVKGIRGKTVMFK
jgi:hypothetical protein